MVEYLTPKARRKLQEQVAELRKRVSELTREYGGAAGFGDGDSYHDETVKMLEEEVRNANRFLAEIQSVLSGSEELPTPQQFEKVAVGHRVGVRLPHDEDVLESVVHVTVVTVNDVRGLSDYFDQTHELLVSNRSLLGSALLGKRVGDVAMYGKRIATIESIECAHVFE